MRIGKHMRWILNHLRLNELGELPPEFTARDGRVKNDPNKNRYLTKWEIIANLFPRMKTSNYKYGAYFQGYGERDKFKYGWYSDQPSFYINGDLNDYDFESQRLHNFVLVTYHNAKKQLLEYGLITVRKRIGPNSEEVYLTDKGREVIKP